MSSETAIAPNISISPASYAPVQADKRRQARDKPKEGIALALSGGGYRAMLFHLGSLWRLNELGVLSQLERVSSVSGGSITAGVLGLRWHELGLDGGANAVASREDFVRLVVAPIRALAGRSIDVSSSLLGVFGPGTAGDWIARAYSKRVFHGATLQDLPDKPRFVINATNVQSGVLWRFSKPYMRDYKVGQIENPNIPLAVAVAASSAFPPFLSPLVLHLQPSQFTPGSGEQKYGGKGDVLDDTFRGKIVLTDGGIYDNLGLETVWKKYLTVLVSDGGGQIEPDAKRRHDWLHHLADVLGWTDNQVRSLRKRQLMDSLTLKSRTRGGPDDGRDGAYWGIRADLAKYGLTDALPCPLERTMELAKTPTRLTRLDATRQEQLINWGYAACDAALRKHCAAPLIQPTPPARFPYVGGVG